MKAMKLISILLAFSMIFCLGACGGKVEETTTEETTLADNGNSSVQPVGNTNPLTGKTGYDEAKLSDRYVAIVVENSPAARPQWGLCSPDILLEYEVEGGITRMLWLYASADEIPEKVGPVRSARHDPVEIALGTDAIFVHWGKSNLAENTINENSSIISDIDGLTYSGCFFRDSSRNVSSEHTGYLTGEALRSSLSSLGIRTTINEGFTSPLTFGAANLTAGTCSKLYAEFSSSYTYSFNFDSASGLYNTKINGNDRTDSDGKIASYENVIILYVDNTDVLDSSGHIDMKLENGGSGVYASGGKYEKITWTKTGVTEPIKLFAADGSALTLNAGNSYMGLVRSTQQAKTVIE